MAISKEQFIQRASREIYIPGFSETDEPIEIRVRALSVVALMANKKIPNQLMPAVEQIFKIGASSTNIQEADKVAEENLLELTEFLSFICKEAMVEPTFDEVGEYLTEEQMMSIFEATQTSTKQLIPFNNQ